VRRRANPPSPHVAFDNRRSNARVNDALQDSYNDVPYVSAPDPAHHPDRLATIGTLFGLDIAPLAACRVLEVACGDGSNLIPIAAALPRASFTGFDFAAQPLARARRMADGLGLANLRLLECDLRALPADLGPFDYVIAHGLYSWVPADVRAHVLPMIAQHLAPNGVAFVSYNTLPGCRLRAAAWDMIRHHTHDVADRRAKVAAARTLLGLAGMPVAGDDALQQAMRAEFRNAAAASDSALAHDDLAELNHPVLFSDFAADAARAGLAYVAESHSGAGSDRGLAEPVRKALAQLDRLAREQYLDFVRLRHYRESLLCHANALPRFDVRPERASGLYAVPSLATRRAHDANAPSPATGEDAGAITRYLLERWPASVPLAELAEWLARRPAGSGKAARPIEDWILELDAAGIVDLRTRSIDPVTVTGERPEVFAPARWLARERDVIPSLYHEGLRFQDPEARTLIALLDGTRTRDAIAQALGGVVTSPVGRARLDAALQVLARKALLVA
jgi:2-polyprenyl-3-methyl-5-hydroxy-6-metoxy-1,4-benzoquinol methylase